MRRTSMAAAAGLLVLSCALTAASAAEGRLFVTKLGDGPGLVDPNNALRPTFSTVDIYHNDYNAYDYNFGQGPYVIAAFPPADAPGYYGAVMPGDILYIWTQFDASQPKNMTINALEVRATVNGVLVPDAQMNNAFYLCNDSQAQEGFAKRWNGTATAPNYPELADNSSQILIAVTASGIVKAGSPQLWNLYSGTAAGAVTLLGAMQVPAIYGLGEVYYIQGGYTSGPFNPAQWGHATFTIIPEPAAGLLLTLAALRARRR